ncbi:MAG: hydrogenase expression/formation C-terminal domain-containing protein [Enterobacteriaceae bacterium]
MNVIAKALPISEPPLTEADKQEILHARGILRVLLADFQRWQGDEQAYPLYTLSVEERANSALLDQILGEGEVSAKVRFAGGDEQHIQETVFTGIWRLHHYNEQHQLVSDQIAICPVPVSLWQQQATDERPDLPTQDQQELMNGAFIAREILFRLQQNPPEQHVINLTLLPLSDHDREYLGEFLGEGASALFSRGYGKCRIVSTRLPGVWRINYFNDNNVLLQDMIEITRVPEIAMAGAEDIADSAQRLREVLIWLDQELLTCTGEPADEACMECKTCWWVYDPSQGDDVWQIAPGTPFRLLPDYWRCPGCDGDKQGFLLLQKELR